MAKIDLFVGLRNSGKTTALKNKADENNYLYVKNDNANWMHVLNICNSTNVKFEYILVDDITLDNLKSFFFSEFKNNEKFIFSMCIDINDIPRWVFERFNVIECIVNSSYSTQNISLIK